MSFCFLVDGTWFRLHGGGMVIRCNKNSFVRKIDPQGFSGSCLTVVCLIGLEESY
jgi:hypothetical protein